MREQSRRLSLNVWGDFACFTRPELKAERVSYELMTPSAARGVLDAILWKPAIEWRVHEIAVLKPIKWFSFRRNELKSAAGGKNKDPIRIEDERTQRNLLGLRDVSYRIDASFVMTGRAGADDTVAKFEQMFLRRVERGQSFHQPYLGCREFPAFFAPCDEPATAIDESRPLGLMFFDFEYPPTRKKRKAPAPAALFFDARLHNGVVSMPCRDALVRVDGSTP